MWSNSPRKWHCETVTISSPIAGTPSCYGETTRLTEGYWHCCPGAEPHPRTPQHRPHPHPPSQGFQMNPLKPQIWMCSSKPRLARQQLHCIIKSWSLSPSLVCCPENRSEDRLYRNQFGSIGHNPWYKSIPSDFIISLLRLSPKEMVVNWQWLGEGGWHFTHKGVHTQGYLERGTWNNSCD